MKTKELYEVAIAIKKEDKEKFLTELQEKELIHLKKIESFNELKIEDLNELEKKYLDFSSVINWIKKYKEDELIKEYKEVKPLRDNELIEKAYERIQEILKFIRKLERLENIEIPNIKKKIQILTILDKLGISKPEDLRLSNFLIYLFSLNEEQYKLFKKKSEDFENLIVDKKIIKENNNYYVLLITKEKVECSFKSILDEIFKVLSENELKESVYSLLKKFENKLKEIEEKKEKLKKSIFDIFDRYQSLILQVYKSLKEEIEKIKEKNKIRESEHFVIIKGYVPKEKFNELLSILKNYNYLIEKKEVKPTEEAPTLIENPKLRAFQNLIEQYGTVKYGWLDPTLFFAVSFTIFYGFIIGDIGYGLLLLLIGLFLKGKEKTKELGNLIIVLSLSSIIFGLLFGSLFGFKIIEKSFDPTYKKNLILMIIISVSIGLIYLTLGSISSIYYGLKTKDLNFVLENFAFLSFIYGLIILIFLKNLYLGIILIILAILSILKSKGVLGVFDLSSFVGSVLSFARIGALAISGAFIPFLINKLFYYLVNVNKYLIIIAVPLTIILHLANFVMTIVGAAIHSLRLNYLEFFGRVFKEGKEKFKPFGRLSKEF